MAIDVPSGGVYLTDCNDLAESFSESLNNPLLEACDPYASNGKHPAEWLPFWRWTDINGFFYHWDGNWFTRNISKAIAGAFDTIASIFLFIAILCWEILAALYKMIFFNDLTDNFTLTTIHWTKKTLDAITGVDAITGDIHNTTSLFAFVGVLAAGVAVWQMSRHGFRKGFRSLVKAFVPLAMLVLMLNANLVLADRLDEVYGNDNISTSLLDDPEGLSISISGHPNVHINDSFDIVGVDDNGVETVLPHNIRQEYLKGLGLHVDSMSIGDRLAMLMACERSARRQVWERRWEQDPFDTSGYWTRPYLRVMTDQDAEDACIEAADNLYVSDGPSTYGSLSGWQPEDNAINHPIGTSLWYRYKIESITELVSKPVIGMVRGLSGGSDGGEVKYGCDAYDRVLMEMYYLGAQRMSVANGKDFEKGSPRVQAPIALSNIWDRAYLTPYAAAQLGTGRGNLRGRCWLAEARASEVDPVETLALWDLSCVTGREEGNNPSTHLAGCRLNRAYPPPSDLSLLEGEHEEDVPVAHSRVRAYMSSIHAHMTHSKIGLLPIDDENGFVTRLQLMLCEIPLKPFNDQTSYKLNVAEISSSLDELRVLSKSPLPMSGYTNEYILEDYVSVLVEHVNDSHVSWSGVNLGKLVELHIDAHGDGASPAVKSIKSLPGPVQTYIKQYIEIMAGLAVYSDTLNYLKHSSVLDFDISSDNTLTENVDALWYWVSNNNKDGSSTEDNRMACNIALGNFHRNTVPDTSDPYQVVGFPYNRIRPGGPHLVVGKSGFPPAVTINGRNLTEELLDGSTTHAYNDAANVCEAVESCFPHFARQLSADQGFPKFPSAYFKPVGQSQWHMAVNLWPACEWINPKYEDGSERTRPGYFPTGAGMFRMKQSGSVTDVEMVESGGVDENHGYEVEGRDLNPNNFWDEDSLSSDMITDLGTVPDDVDGGDPTYFVWLDSDYHGVQDEGKDHERFTSLTCAMFMLAGLNGEGDNNNRSNFYGDNSDTETEDIGTGFFDRHVHNRVDLDQGDIDKSLSQIVSGGNGDAYRNTASTMVSLRDRVHEQNGYDRFHRLIYAGMALVTALVFFKSIIGLTLGTLIAQFILGLAFMFLPFILIMFAMPIRSMEGLPSRFVKLLFGATLAHTIFMVILTIILVVMDALFQAFRTVAAPGTWQGVILLSAIPIVAIKLVAAVMKKAFSLDITSIKGAMKTSSGMAFSNALSRGVDNVGTYARSKVNQARSAASRGYGNMAALAGASSAGGVMGGAAAKTVPAGAIAGGSAAGGAAGGAIGGAAGSTGSGLLSRRGGDGVVAMGSRPGSGFGKVWSGSNEYRGFTGGQQSPSSGEANLSGLLPSSSEPSSSLSSSQSYVPPLAPSVPASQQSQPVQPSSSQGVSPNTPPNAPNVQSGQPSRSGVSGTSAPSGAGQIPQPQSLTDFANGDGNVRGGGSIVAGSPPVSQTNISTPRSEPSGSPPSSGPSSARFTGNVPSSPATGGPGGVPLGGGGQALPDQGGTMTPSAASPSDNVAPAGGGGGYAQPQGSSPDSVPSTGQSRTPQVKPQTQRPQIVVPLPGANMDLQQLPNGQYRLQFSHFPGEAITERLKASGARWNPEGKFWVASGQAVGVASSYLPQGWAKNKWTVETMNSLQRGNDDKSDAVPTSGGEDVSSAPSSSGQSAVRGNTEVPPSAPAGSSLPRPSSPTGIQPQRQPQTPAPSSTGGTSASHPQSSQTQTSPALRLQPQAPQQRSQAPQQQPQAPNPQSAPASQPQQTTTPAGQSPPQNVVQQPSQPQHHQPRQTPAPQPAPDLHMEQMVQNVLKQNEELREQVNHIAQSSVQSGAQVDTRMIEGVLADLKNKLETVDRKLSAEDRKKAQDALIKTIQDDVAARRSARKRYQ